jgi:transcriptional regulator with XRE-family HTH domain
MRLSEKIVNLRKKNGLSQEDLAEKLNVSRQAVSRWEGGAASPDAANILQLSKLFGVTTDYLLNDEYESDNDLPKVKEVKKDGLRQIVTFMITLEVMILILQFMSVVILQNVVFGVFSFIPFAAVIGGFEYAYQKNGPGSNETTKAFRKKFYKISAWLGAYFPVRLLLVVLSYFIPFTFSSVVLECIILAIYLMTVMLITLEIEKRYLEK